VFNATTETFSTIQINTGPNVVEKLERVENAVVNEGRVCSKEELEYLFFAESKERIISDMYQSLSNLQMKEIRDHLDKYRSLFNTPIYRLEKEIELLKAAHAAMVMRHVAEKFSLDTVANVIRKASSLTYFVIPINEHTKWCSELLKRHFVPYTNMFDCKHYHAIGLKENRYYL
jgi:hypothetical protein